uniref:Coiled-coil-helix-coiled-coil-helix domain containing 3a n=1 Tax=Esox lucius TaxID=8010 RepID=A0A3P8Z7Z8_ESOLU
MGANNSTRRVSFESDENDNITVVKGIRLSENVINRMREPVAPLRPPTVAPTPPTSLPQVPSPPPVLIPSPLLIPVPPLRSPYDPITSLPPPPSKEPITPSPPAPVTEVVTPRPSPLPVEKLEPITPSPTQAEVIDPPPCETIAPPSQPPVETVAPPPVVPPPAPEQVSAAPPPPLPPSAPSAVAEEELRRKITEDLQKGLLQERVKAEQELQAWLEEEKAQAASFARAEAQTSVDDQVAHILELERSAGQESLTQAVMRERISAEDERIRAQLYAKQLELRDQELKKQEAFYREQVARLEDRSAQFYKVTTENYQKAADEVNAKFKRFEVSPVCGDLQGQILKCYQEHTGKTLLCSSIASRYLQCVNQAKQNKLRTGG